MLCDFGVIFSDFRFREVDAAGIIFSTILGDLIPEELAEVGLRFLFLPTDIHPPAVFIKFILGFSPLNLYLNLSYYVFSYYLFYRYLRNFQLSLMPTLCLIII